MSEISLPTGSFRSDDPRASGRRLVNCMSEILPQTGEADLSKSKIPPAYLRRMAGISAFAGEPTPVQPGYYGSAGSVTITAATGVPSFPFGGLWERQGQGYAVVPPGSPSDILATGSASGSTIVNGATLFLAGVVRVAGTLFTPNVGSGNVLLIGFEGTLPQSFVDGLTVTDGTNSFVLSGSTATLNPVPAGGFSFGSPVTVWAWPVAFTFNAGDTVTLGFSSGPVRGMWAMRGITYTVIGGSLFSVSSTGALTLLGSGIPVSNNAYPFVRMTDNTECLFILIPNTNIGFTYTVANGFAQMLASTFLFYGAKDVWFVDSYMVFLAMNGLEFYNDDGQAASGTGPVTFNTGGVFPREFGTDPFIGMCVDHRTVMMLGERTSEGYVNQGNAAESPFGSAPDTFMQIGCHPSCGYTIALQDQSVFWIANDLTVRRRNGQTPSRVSNSGIEAWLEDNKESLAGAYAISPNIGGHPLWVVTFPQASKTFAYDCLTTEWFDLESLYNVLGYWRPLCYLNAFGLQLVGDSQTSQIGFLDANTFAEFSTPQRAAFYTQSVYEQHNRITHRRIELVVTCGGSTTYQSDAKITLLSSDESGAWYVARPTRTLGQQGQRSSRVFWTNLGQSRDRAYGFQVSDPTLLFTVEVTADVYVGKR